MATGNPFTSAQAPNAMPNQAMQLIAPEIAAQQLSVARQQQIAQLLQSKGMGESNPTQMVSGWAVKQSPLEGLSKLAALLGGTYMQQKNDEKNMELQKAFADKLKSTALGGSGTMGQDMSGGSDASNISAQIGGQGSVGGNKFGLNSLIQGQAIEMLGGDNAGKSYWADKATTDMEKQNRYLGIDQNIARQNALAEARVKGTQTLANGQTAILPNGERITGIDQDKGIMTDWVNGQPVSRRIQGTDEILSANAAAIKAGENRGTLAPIDALPRNPDGTYTPATVAQVINPDMSMGAAPKYNDIDQKYGFPPGTVASLERAESNGNRNAVSPKGAQGLFQMMPDTQKQPGYGLGKLDPNNPEDAAKYLSKMRDLSGGNLEGALAKYNAGPVGNPNNPETSSYVKNVMGGIGQAPRGAGEPFGLKKSVEGNVDLANTRYKALVDKNVNAPVMLDALDNVMKYAPGAITGGLADRREFINSLEALVPGFSGATTAQEKTDLLKKNMNRIVGAGSNVPGATDALRNIVEAANPNSKMGLKAINEASRQLKSIIKMEMANQKAIEPYKLNNDFSSVIKNDAEFARNADPKIWELEDMNPQERASFIGGLSPKAAKDLLEKRAKIKSLGGL